MYFRYTDWHQPPEEWEQPTLHEDTHIADLVNLDSPQPSADIGSLCTVMIPKTPHGSLNWAKIPCDYPIFRAGTICKTTASPVRDGR